MSEPEQTPSDQQLVIKRGCLVRVVQFRTLKLITTFLFIFLLIDILFSLKLFTSAIQIRGHLGHFINMVSSGDGDTLPSLQAVPVLFFLILDCMMVFFLYSIFGNVERKDLTRLMFFVTLIGLILLVILFIVIIAVIAHANSAHEELHSGIIKAMSHYNNNTQYKSQMDRLQIEFQCCGSKKYDEWYTINWMDSSLDEGMGSATDGNTPFSCCSMKSLSPCIHHNIEVTGKTYLYTPEFNLSISTRGCYEMIREKKQSVGWGIVGNLCLFFFLQMVTLGLFRFIQTAHFPKGKFEGHSRSYTIWLFGSYAGKVKNDTPKPAPEIPPVPAELQE